MVEMEERIKGDKRDTTAAVSEWPSTLPTNFGATRQFVRSNQPVPLFVRSDAVDEVPHDG